MAYEKYCTQCGTELIRVPKPANELSVDIAPECSLPLGDKYNSKTGYRQFGIVVMCPKARFWNWHTSFVDEYSLHDSDLPELIK